MCNLCKAHCSCSTMILNRFIIYAYLCIARAKSDCTSSENLVDEYYTTTPTETIDYITQDETDAKTILESSYKEDIVAGILLYRDKIRRYAIGEHIVEVRDATHTWKGRTTHYKIRTPWITAGYHTQLSSFKDLCYALIKDESLVMGGYLSNFFNSKKESHIVIGMVLTKDMNNMIKTYDKYHEKGYRIKDLRKSQRETFEHMLRVWVRHNREPIEKEELNQDCITKDVNALKAEQENCGWAKNRDQIELISMKKSIKYARAVIEKIEKDNGGKAFEDLINGNIQTCKLDQGLADAYASLVRYIKDKYTYIADIMRKHSDGEDQWAVWSMCVAVIHPYEWPKVDEAFKKDHKDDSLSKFILQKIPDDKVIAEMFAKIVDPNFKPTTFTENQGQKIPEKSAS